MNRRVFIAALATTAYGQYTPALGRRDFIRPAAINMQTLQSIQGTQQKYALLPAEKAVFDRMLNMKGIFSGQYQITDVILERMAGPEPDQQFARRYRTYAQNSITHLTQEYLGNALPAPHIDVVAPTTPADFHPAAKPVGQRQTMYLGRYYDVATVSYTVKGRPGSIQTQEKLSKPSDADFEIVTIVDFGNPARIVQQKEITPILISTASAPVLLAESPALEALHTQMNPLTIERANASARQARSKEEAINRIRECFNREEQIVHGIAKHWFEQYDRSANIGFSEQEILQHHNRYSILPKYQGALDVYEQVKKLGPREIIHRYRMNKI